MLAMEQSEFVLTKKDMTKASLRTALLMEEAIFNSFGETTLIDELDKVSTLAKDVTAVYLVAKVTFALHGQDGGETSWQTTPTHFTDYHGRKNQWKACRVNCNFKRTTWSV